MLVIDISIRGSSALRDDSFDLLVALELLGLSFLVDLERLDVLSTSRRIAATPSLFGERTLDVILDSLESFERAKAVKHLPRVVDVTIALPFDEVAHVPLRLVSLVVGCANLRQFRHAKVKPERLTVLSISFVAEYTVDRITSECCASRQPQRRSKVQRLTEIEGSCGGRVFVLLLRSADTKVHLGLVVIWSLASPTRRVSRSLIKFVENMLLLHLLSFLLGRSAEI